MNRLSAGSSDTSSQLTDSSDRLSFDEHKRSSRWKRSKGPIEFNVSEWEQRCKGAFESTIEPRMNHSAEAAHYLLQNREFGLLVTAQGTWGEHAENERDLQAARAIVERLGAEYRKSYRPGAPGAPTRSVAESGPQLSRVAPPATAFTQVNHQQHTGNHIARTGDPSTAQRETLSAATTAMRHSSYRNRPARSNGSAQTTRALQTRVDYDQTWWKERCENIYRETLKPTAYDNGTISAEQHGYRLEEAEQGLFVLAHGKSGAVMHGYADLAGNDPTAYYNKVRQQMLDLAHELRKDYELPRPGPRRSTVPLHKSGQGHFHEPQSQARVSPSTGAGTGNWPVQPRTSAIHASAITSDDPLQHCKSPQKQHVANTPQASSRLLSSSLSVAPAPVLRGRTKVDILRELHCLPEIFDARLGGKQRLRLQDLSTEWTRLLKAETRLNAEASRANSVKVNEPKAVKQLDLYAKIYLKHLGRIAVPHEQHCEWQMNQAVKCYRGWGTRTLQAVEERLQWLDGQYQDLRNELKLPLSLKDSSSWSKIAALQKRLRATLTRAYTSARGKFELEWRKLHMYSNKRGLWKATTNNTRTKHTSEAFRQYQRRYRDKRAGTSASKPFSDFLGRLIMAFSSPTGSTV